MVSGLRDDPGTKGVLSKLTNTLGAQDLRGIFHIFPWNRLMGTQCSSVKNTTRLNLSRRTTDTKIGLNAARLITALARVKLLNPKTFRVGSLGGCLRPAIEWRTSTPFRL